MSFSNIEVNIDIIIIIIIILLFLFFFVCHRYLHSRGLKTYAKKRWYGQQLRSLSVKMKLS